MKKYPHTSKNGAALLMAVLMASVMLSVGLGVYQRTYKELYFSSFWKQAQIAFAAADSGLECALYWDLHKAATASCFGADVVGWDPSGNASASFSINIPCVSIEIIKSGSATTIKSRGYNTCDTNNPRRVERALRIDY